LKNVAGGWPTSLVGSSDSRDTLVAIDSIGFSSADGIGPGLEIPSRAVGFQRGNSFGDGLVGPVIPLPETGPARLMRRLHGQTLADCRKSGQKIFSCWNSLPRLPIF
jgi:hypothetical protein